MFPQLSPCGCGVGLGTPLSSCLRSRAAMGRAGIEPGVQDHSLSCTASHVPYVCMCFSLLSHCEWLSLQDPVSWSTTDKHGMNIASYAAAASSPSGHDPSSQTRRIITVSPVMRASSLLAALVAKRYVWPDSPKSPSSLIQAHVPQSCLSPTREGFTSTPASRWLCAAARFPVPVCHQCALSSRRP